MRYILVAGVALVGSHALVAHGFAMLATLTASARDAEILAFAAKAEHFDLFLFADKAARFLARRLASAMSARMGLTAADETHGD